MMNSLAGKTALITGASGGLGRVIAKRFVEAGASVFLTAFNADDLRAAGEELRSQAPHSQYVGWRAGDVTQPDEVARVVKEAQATLGRIDALVCNAGVQGPIGAVESVPWSEWTRTVEVNLFGTVLYCRAVIPVMREAGKGKIIAISGGGATSPRPAFSAYAASKTALVRFIETVASELAGSGVEANAVAPGSLNTRMLEAILDAGADRAGAAAYEAAVRQKAEGGSPPEVAADLIVFLTSDQSRGISGRLISAQWDDWRSLPERSGELAASDAYTLRRVVPADGGAGSP